MLIVLVVLTSLILIAVIGIGLIVVGSHMNTKNKLIKEMGLVRGKIIAHINRLFRRSDIKVPDVEVASDDEVFRREIEKLGR